MGQFSQEEIERGIARLDERIANLRAFDVQTASKGNPPSLEGLQSDIADTLERIFGRNTPAYRRFQGAARLIVPAQGGGFFGLRPIHEYYPDELAKNIGRSIALLEAAQRVLREDLADAQHATASLPVPTGPETSTLSRRVFVVHGHDGEARETVARFLTAMGFEPVILHEQANQGRTIIEKFEAHGDVGFAVVLLTPDDEGRAKGGELQSRARQNVVLELGYFIGKLGRGKVCALKRGELELPSDYLGVVWERMDDGGGWKLALARELKAAGHIIDGNKVI
ncbi:nucleotide-binding protein [Burkholderia sp. BCC1998]|uniref:nucleotide-binding protein n=1 Tax=Burkholderia sp. BCC1998 TaxID=2817447 RepID=UPI002AB681B0|nr:nucleotide-binding protein [Burkholderia sp. BCC1998]